MKRNMIYYTLLAVLATMVVSCHKDTPTEGGNSDTTGMWPVKKISRMVHCVGTLDYLTYDFTWDGNLLKEISCTMYDGTSLGRTILEYEGGRLASVYPCDGAGRVYTDGAMHYHYGEDGRLKRQTFMLPVRATGNLCPQTYDEIVPCELVYSYSDNGCVSTVHANKTKDDGSVETSSYLFEWNGGNVTSITCDGQSLINNMQYDNNPNPMHFPMGMETMCITNMIFEGVLGNSVLFLGYASCWCENNMTTLVSGNGQCSYTYDAEGFPTTKTITIGGENTVYQFTYKPDRKCK